MNDPFASEMVNRNILFIVLLKRFIKTNGLGDFKVPFEQQRNS